MVQSSKNIFNAYAYVQFAKIVSTKSNQKLKKNVHNRNWEDFFTHT